MERQIQYDDLVDPAFAEIYHIVSEMEEKDECCTDMDCESLAHECRKLAYDFAAVYEDMCRCGEPDYWSMIDSWARSKAKEKWPPLKRFDVLIDANVTMTYKALARDRKDAEEMAHKFMESPQFDQWLRTKLRIYEAEIGDVTEGGRNESIPGDLQSAGHE